MLNKCPSESRQPMLPTKSSTRHQKISLPGTGYLYSVKYKANALITGYIPHITSQEHIQKNPYVLHKTVFLGQNSFDNHHLLFLLSFRITHYSILLLIFKTCSDSLKGRLITRCREQKGLHNDKIKKTEVQWFRYTDK